MHCILCGCVEEFIFFFFVALFIIWKMSDVHCNMYRNEIISERIQLVVPFMRSKWFFVPALIQLVSEIWIFIPSPISFICPGVMTYKWRLKACLFAGWKKKRSKPWCGACHYSETWQNRVWWESLITNSLSEI